MDEAAKKTLLRHIPSGLYVVGAAFEGKVHGFTGSWFSQVSFTPPVVMLGVKSDSFGCELMVKSGSFSVNYFDKDQIDIIKGFFKVDPEKVLNGLSFTEGTTGSPLLGDAMGTLECKIIKSLPGIGDHTPVFGEVVEATILRDVPPIIMSDTPWKYGG